MQTFTTMFLDQDGDFTAWPVAGEGEAPVLRDFLMDVCPESVHQLEPLTTVDELRAWAAERECLAEVVRH